MALLVYQRVNLHGFSMVFQWVFPLKPPFSYGFPMVFPLKPPFSYGFPMVFPWMSISPQMDALVGKLVDLPSKPSRRRDRRARGLDGLEDTKNGSCAGFGGPMKVPRINEALINEFNQAIISGWWFGPLPKKNPDLGCGIIQCINLPFGYD